MAIKAVWILAGKTCTHEWLPGTGPQKQEAMNTKEKSNYIERIGVKGLAARV